MLKMTLFNKLFKNLSVILGGSKPRHMLLNYSACVDCVVEVVVLVA